MIKIPAARIAEFKFIVDMINGHHWLAINNNSFAASVTIDILGSKCFVAVLPYSFHDGFLYIIWISYSRHLWASAAQAWATA